MLENAIVGIGGWAIKPFALLVSSFAEAVLMDADVLFVQKPEVLFEHPEYATTGTLFFHDRSLFINRHETKDASICLTPSIVKRTLHGSSHFLRVHMKCPSLSSPCGTCSAVQRMNRRAVLC